MSVYFEIPGPPQGKGRARVSTTGGFARAYTPQKTAAYESLVKLCFCAKYPNMKPLEGSLKMHVTAMYAVPKSLTKKKKLDALTGVLLPEVKPDLDNILKVICDGLNGIAYKDDKQITTLNSAKLYDEVPRVIVTIE